MDGRLVLAGRGRMQAEACFAAIKDSQKTITIDCAMLRELVVKHKGAKQQAYQFIRSKIVVHQGQVQSIETCNEMLPGFYSYKQIPVKS